MIFLYILVDRIHIIESNVLADFSFIHFKRRKILQKLLELFPDKFAFFFQGDISCVQQKYVRAF